MTATALRPSEDTHDREVVLSRVYDAPRALVYEAWTRQEHVERWWGPNGFTNTFERFEVRPGGVWVFTMHGPDGQNYPNSIVFQEVVPEERLVYGHGGGDPDAPPEFHVTVTFADRDGGTEVTMHHVFPTAEALALVVREHNAIEGGRQHLGRLAEHLATMR